MSQAQELADAMNGTITEAEAVDTTEYGALRENAERARLALNATPWWRPIKRQEAANRYKHALLMGAFWEVDARRVVLTVRPKNTSRVFTAVVHVVSMREV